MFNPPSARTLRLTFKVFVTFIARFRSVIFIGTVIGVLLFIIGFLVVPRISGSKTQRIGVTGRYYTDTLPSWMLHLIGDGLTRIDSENGSVLPSLAESWESQDEGKKWIFKLKEGEKWQDGTPVTSQSVNYSFSDVQIEAPDDLTIVFNLKEPFSPFPSIVSSPTFKRGLLGTGEWRVGDIRLRQNIVEQMLLVDTNGNRRVYKFYPTEDGTKLAFKLGKIDKIQEIIDPYPFKSWNNVDLSSDIKFNKYVAVFFNMEDPVVGGLEGRSSDSKKIRQALAYALDKESFEGPRALGPINPNSWGYNPLLKDYKFDKERALELIDELPDEVRDGLEINLATFVSLLPVAEQIATAWNDVGIKTNIQVAGTVPSSFQALLAIHDIPPDPDQYSSWHSTQEATNISNYKNPRIDKLLEDGRTQLKQETRREIYLDFQRFLIEDSSAIFLYHPTTYSIARK